MNKTLLRDFSLAYYYRSLENSGFKTIDVALYTDQNYQKLKSYGYAFSHPEQYVMSQAKSAYNVIIEDPEKKRLYEFFEDAVNSGTAQFDISFMFRLRKKGIIRRTIQYIISLPGSPLK